MDQNVFYLKSMTAFSRTLFNFDQGRFVIEIHSLNRRHLEINVNLPTAFSGFEMEVRKKIAERVGRGMVTFDLNWEEEGRSSLTVIPNLTLAKAIKAAWEKIAFDLGIEEKVGLRLIAEEGRDLLMFKEEIKDVTPLGAALEKAMTQGLDQLDTMKREEGQRLSTDLHRRAHHLKEMLQNIESLGPDIVERQRKKLTQRLNDLFPTLENEDKVHREIAVFTERIDITEEIVRFKGHLVEFSRLLQKPFENTLETRGKLLDFLIQEMNREITTISSKAADLQIAQLSVQIKGELEKMREQVQNIE